MRGVGVCVAAAVAAVLAIGGPRPSVAGIEKEAAIAQDSDNDDGEECEENSADEECAESTAQQNGGGRKADPGRSNLDPDLVPEHVLFFSGTDIWRNGSFSHSGLFWAYRGLDGDGPVLKLLLNSGLYRYYSGRKEIVGFQAMGAALPGWPGTGPD